MWIGFSGTRNGMTEAQKSVFRSWLTPHFGSEFHHGDCEGSDAQAHDIAKELGCHIVAHPPDNPVARAYKKADVILPTAPYLVRNRDIVDATELLVAAPFELTEQPKGGTWYTIRYARSLGGQVRIILPNGEVVDK